MAQSRNSANTKVIFTEFNAHSEKIRLEKKKRTTKVNNENDKKLCKQIRIILTRQDITTETKNVTLVEIRRILAVWMAFGKLINVFRNKVPRIL